MSEILAIVDPQQRRIERLRRMLSDCRQRNASLVERIVLLDQEIKRLSARAHHPGPPDGFDVWLNGFKGRAIR